MLLDNLLDLLNSTKIIDLDNFAFTCVPINNFNLQFILIK